MTQHATRTSTSYYDHNWFRLLDHRLTRLQCYFTSFCSWLKERNINASFQNLLVYPLSGYPEISTSDFSHNLENVAFKNKKEWCAVWVQLCSDGPRRYVLLASEQAYTKVPRPCTKMVGYFELWRWPGNKNAVRYAVTDILLSSWPISSLYFTIRTITDPILSNQDKLSASSMSDKLASNAMRNAAAMMASRGFHFSPFPQPSITSCS